MEMQIQDLVTAIKKEGVEAARSEADKILEQAKKEAAALLAKAQSEADTLVKKAEEKAEIIKGNAVTAAEHAKRDALLFFKESVQEEFRKLLQADVEKAVDTALLAQLITAALRDEQPCEYAAEVREITEGLKSELSQALQEGLEIRANPHVRIGFKLLAKDGSGYFDCSDEELEQLLSPFFPEFSV